MSMVNGIEPPWTPQINRRSARRLASSGFQLASEGERPLAAGRVDPNHVREVGGAVGSRSTPTTVTDATHRRMDLVVHRRGVHVDDAVKHLRSKLEGSVGVAGEYGRSKAVVDTVGHSNG